MARHRSYSIESKRPVVQEFLGGETLYGLARRHDVSRNLIRVWVAKYEAGAFDDEFQAADRLQQYEAKIAALERGHHLRRGGVGIRLCRADTRRLVTPCRRLHDRSVHRRSTRRGGTRGRHSADALTTRIADLSTPWRATAMRSPSTGWWDR